MKANNTGDPGNVPYDIPYTVLVNDPGHLQHIRVVS